MGRIAVFTDLEEGHLLASFGLARALTKKGHEVVYLAPPPISHTIIQNGFPVEEILTDILPLGIDRTDGQLSGSEERARSFEALISGRALDQAMYRFRPSLVIVHSVLALEALTIRYRYRVPVVILTTALLAGSRRGRLRMAVNDAIEMGGGYANLVELLSQQGCRISRPEDIADLLVEMPEFLCQPREFDIPSRIAEPNLFHIGAALDPLRAEPEFCWDGFDFSRPIVLCSLGSQAHLRPKTSIRFFQRVIQAFALRPDWQLIIALGPRLSSDALGVVPRAVHVCAWAPQVQVLRRAAAMITHAGMGTVRECIDLAVPMIAFPLMRDQFDNRELITHHGIGVAGDLNTARPAEIVALVEHVLCCDSFRGRLQAVRALFAQQEEMALAIEFLERHVMREAAVNWSSAHPSAEGARP